MKCQSFPVRGLHSLQAGLGQLQQQPQQQQGPDSISNAHPTNPGVSRHFGFEKRLPLSAQKFFEGK